MLPKGANRERILPTLEETGITTPDTIQRAAEKTGVPAADVYGVGSFYSLLSGPETVTRVCQGLSCWIAGSDDVLANLKAQGKPAIAVSCLAQCDRAPALLDSELNVVAEPRAAVSPADPELPMNLAGDDTQAYAALARAIEMGPEGVLDTLDASGLQGRGGAGFPAAIKWRMVSEQPVLERYVVCNADEAEPGTFKDREVMLRRPHRILEGLAIAAFAVGSKDVYLYIRGEFKAERAAIEKAIQEAPSWPVEGLTFTIVDGHGAYICGEETALLESMEGRRGMPRLKPPYPTVSGFRGKPTLMNNVETLACVPEIILRGGEWFKALGKTEPGTKLYCLSGHVKQPGVYELPMGVCLDELVAAGGGYVGEPQAFSPGGASAGFLPMSQREVPLDFQSLKAAGSMLGSAGVVVLNSSVDMAKAARNQAVFFEDETCGQCAPCRIGCRVIRRDVDRYLETGDPSALEQIEDLSWEMEEGSICGLGIAAPLSVVSAIKHFPESFGKRPAGGQA
jgi:NADH:ubiquinone oxidoreductase subunit F (NADH-binding)